MGNESSYGKNQAEAMVMMLDAGWTLAAIADHFAVDVNEVERAIIEQLKLERNHG